MGDHRADITIDFKIHGKKYHQNWWINYSPDDDGVDNRIKEWFEECWLDAKSRYDKQVREYFKREHAAEIEREEREHLKRLQEKYPT